MTDDQIAMMLCERWQDGMRLRRRDIQGEVEVAPFERLLTDVGAPQSLRMGQ